MRIKKTKTLLDRYFHRFHNPMSPHQRRLLHIRFMGERYFRVLAPWCDITILTRLPLFDPRADLLVPG